MLQKAIRHIQNNGVLLIFPLKGRSEPRSLWSCLFPKKEMVWEWTDDVDDEVVQMWHLRTELSLCDEVVYSKWFQGRATVFSLEAFTALCAGLENHYASQEQLPLHSFEILSALEDNSPLATRRLRSEVELTGKENESLFTKALAGLWRRGLIVGCGEADEGGFPSLCVGATKVVKEELWDASISMPRSKAEEILHRAMPEGSPFRKALDKILNDKGPSKP